jgi:hypothetical protein
MKRAKKATLAEIMEATGWQKHTVRGFRGESGPTVLRVTDNTLGGVSGIYRNDSAQLDGAL